MFSVYGNAIKLTRGDTLILTVSLTRDGDIASLSEGDTVKFALKSKLNPKQTAYVEDEPLISKSIPIDTMVLQLDPEDTKELDFGNYFYDIEITFADGRVDTVINNASFVLKPEVA